MKQRWYDADPTLSMAISLLHNATKVHQEMAAQYMLKLIESRHLLDSEALRTREDRVRFFFSPFRRSNFDTQARYLVEVIKHLEWQAQQDMAVALINYIYVLDGGLSELSLSELLEEEATLAQPELG
jgi:hypothetical protein